MDDGDLLGDDTVHHTIGAIGRHDIRSFAAGEMLEELLDVGGIVVVVATLDELR